MSEIHIPVMLNEVLEAFSVFNNKKKLTYYDATYGRGGHFRAIYEKFNPECSFLSDQDITAINMARQQWGVEIVEKKVQVFHGNFLEFINSGKEVLFDMVLIDLGISSPQVDNAERGFSFNKDGPLDMRMNQVSLLDAAKIINEYSEEELIEVFQKYGEIDNPKKVVRAIIQDRIKAPFSRTLQLAGLIERVDGWRKKGFHPATQYFMALRLVVNQELQVTESVLPLIISRLQDQGRLVVITFHSLEDRIVKNIFKNNDQGFMVNKKVVVPTEEECRINPRARSAKLRIFHKGVQPEKPDKFAVKRALKNNQQ